jgi:tetratricopeptide (TPR) repeat protein
MSQKEKFLNSAQKFIAKGQLDRAVNDFEQAVALDPQDLRCRQRLAELLVKANRKDDAVREFETIGKYYADNGYFLKAIAVYKQMQKLAPQNMDITIALGDLNEKQGLKGNALSEYRTAVEFYQKAGNLTEAGNALDRMIAVDEGNVSILIKKAELLHAGHLAEKAYQEFVAAAVMMNGSGDEAAFQELCARMRKLFPEREDFLTEVARRFLESGNAEKALDIVTGIVESGTGTLRDWETLLDAYKGAGDLQKRCAKAREMVKQFPRSLPVREKLLEAIADSGDREEAISDLESSLKDFPEAGWTEIEPLYKILLEKDPANVTLLHGLKELYRKAGKRTKVDDIEKRIALLAAGGVATEEAGGASFPSHAAPQSSPAGGAEPTGWESELQLNLSSPEELHLEQESESSRETLSLPDSPDLPVMEDSLDLDLTESAQFSGGDRGLEIELPELSLSDIDFGQGEEPQVSVVSAERETLAPPPEEEGASDDLFDYLDLGDDVEPPSIPAPREELPGIDDFPVLDEVEELEELEELEEIEKIEEIEEELSPEPDVEPEPADLPCSDMGGALIDGILVDLAEKCGRTVSDEDTETHFNLGIAYMEMGLYDEAVAEFLSASADPARKTASATLIGISLREKGDLAGAERIFSSLLEGERMSEGEAVNLRYEYALLLEIGGRMQEAADEYIRVHAEDPTFREVGMKVAVLRGDAVEEMHELELLEEDLEELA